MPTLLPSETMITHPAGIYNISKVNIYTFIYKEPLKAVFTITYGESFTFIIFCVIILTSEGNSRGDHYGK